jgi:hypothetical protein
MSKRRVECLYILYLLYSICRDVMHDYLCSLLYRSYMPFIVVPS